MGSLSIWHWLIVAIVAGILFFGWKQMPDMARSLGRSMRIFKTEIKGMTADDKARDDAHAGEETAKQAPAIEARRAEIVKNEAVRPAARPGPRPAPSPSPSPNGSSASRTPGAC